MDPLPLIAINSGVALLVALAVMSVAFWLGVRAGRFRGVDQAWGLAFAAIAVSTLMISSGHGSAWHRWIVAAATVLWALRLSVHIRRQARGSGEDPRYRDMLARATGNHRWHAFSRIHLTQAVAAWFVSLPVQLALFQPDVSPVWLGAGIILWMVGFVFEAGGDAQLAAFRADPANRGTVLCTGLWRYTRHPNYFGDACVWWGLYLMACGWLPGAATILSPVVMTYFLAAKTGKPLMERHLAESRPGYADYVRRTSGFIPLPPRR